MATASYGSQGSSGSGGGGGGGSVNSVTATANTGIAVGGTAADPVLSGIASSASVPGTMSVADFSKLLAMRRPKAGTALTDADQTVQPFTDKVSLYTQTAALTGNRSKTAGVTSAFTGLTLYFAREDTAAFTMAIVNGGTNGGTLFTFAASPTEKQLAAVYYNGTDWVLSGFWFVLST